MTRPTMLRAAAGLLAAAGLWLGSPPPTSAADSLLTFTDLAGMTIYHVYSASDGKSYLEQIRVPSTQSTAPAGTPAQSYFNLKPAGLNIGRGVAGSIFTWHWASDYRHLIIPLQGSLFFDLGDGRTLELKPGEAILAEDWTGRGHRSGCAASTARTSCVGIDILLDANPHTLPLRVPPAP